jgi:hypothetical protein
MINAKAKILRDSSPVQLESEINEFLSKVDIRQVVKMEYDSKEHIYSCLIVYVDIEDIRDIIK